MRHIIFSILISASALSFSTALKASEKYDLLTVESFPQRVTALSEDVLLLRSNEVVIKLTCTSGDTELEILKPGQAPQQYRAQDFYSHGCKSLIRSLEKLELTDLLDVEFYGENIYPGLLIGFGYETLVFTPSGSGTRAFEKLNVNQVQ